jgi:hypothetical protein
VNTTVREVIQTVGIPLADLAAIGLGYTLFVGAALQRRVQLLLAVLASIGMAAILVGALVLTPGTPAGASIGAGSTLVLAALPATFSLARGTPRRRPTRSTGFILVGLAVTLAAAVPTIVELAVDPANGGTAARHPITVQVATSVLVLVATYLVIEQAVDQQEALQRKPAIDKGLDEMRKAINFLDGLLLSLCLDDARRRHLPTVAPDAGRRARERFVRQHLRSVLASEVTYSAASKSRSLVEVPRLQSRLQETFLLWGAVLTRGQETLPVIVALPEAIEAASDLSESLSLRVHHPGLRGDIDDVLEALRAYQRERRLTARRISQIIDR